MNLLSERWNILFRLASLVDSSEKTTAKNYSLFRPGVDKNPLTYTHNGSRVRVGRVKKFQNF